MYFICLSIIYSVSSLLVVFGGFELSVNTSFIPDFISGSEKYLLKDPISGFFSLTTGLLLLDSNYFFK